MAKLFYTLKEASAKLDKNEAEVKLLISNGQLQEFRDRDKIMLKVDQVDLIANGGYEEPIGIAPEFNTPPASAEAPLDPLAPYKDQATAIVEFVIKTVEAAGAFHGKGKDKRILFGEIVSKDGQITSVMDRTVAAVAAELLIVANKP